MLSFKISTKPIRVISFLLCLVLVFAAAGCGKKNETTTTSFNLKINGSKVYPMKSDSELSLWSSLNPILSTSYSNFGDTPLAKELEVKTGVKVNYIHPAQGQEREQFNLLLASNEFPDIVMANWWNIGPDKSIENGYIAELSKAFDEWAPNLKKYLDENSEIDRMCKSDTGKYYVVPNLRENINLGVYTGPIVRKDWLDELGLDMPETLDDWEKMLTMFKEKKNADIPISIALGSFTDGFISGAFNTRMSFYIDNNGEIKYGPLDAGYKDFLMLMNKWYVKGLLDKNFSALDFNQVQTNILNSRAGATFSSASGGMGRWLDSMKSENKNFNLAGAKYPVAKKGDRAPFSKLDWQYTTGSSYAVSKNCKNIELAARWLDYGFSEEGHMLYNFGIEGVSYKMGNSYPKLTELITNNPDGKTMAAMLPQYLMGSYSGPFVQDTRIVEQVQIYPQQKEAVKTWADTDEKKHKLPLVTFTADESSEFSSVMSQIKTFVEEKTCDFIMGVESFDNYDEFITELKNMQIERAIEVQAKALERYENR